MKIQNKANENQEKLIAMLHFFIFLLNIEVELGAVQVWTAGEI